jgi:DNA-binding GntR family transcriptional regulator
MIAKPTSIKNQTARTSTYSEPLNEQIYQQLRWGLIIGDYRPGDTMSIRTIAAKLGAGLMPVREALKRLATERALSSANKRSFKVSNLAPKQVSDLFFIRARLEGIATELATPLVTQGLLTRLDELASQMDEDIDKNDFRSFLARNYSFHFTIYTAAQNEELVHVIENLWAQSGPFLAHGVQVQGLSEEWQLFHTKIATAIRNRDAIKARELIEIDIGWGVEEFGNDDR